MISSPDLYLSLKDLWSSFLGHLRSRFWAPSIVPYSKPYASLKDPGVFKHEVLAEFEQDFLRTILA
jgi:hypothetical protein